MKAIDGMPIYRVSYYKTVKKYDYVQAPNADKAIIFLNDMLEDGRYFDITTFSHYVADQVDKTPVGWENEIVGYTRQELTERERNRVKFMRDTDI